VDVAARCACCGAYGGVHVVLRPPSCDGRTSCQRPWQQIIEESQNLDRRTKIAAAIQRPLAASDFDRVSAGGAARRGTPLLSASARQPPAAARPARACAAGYGVQLALNLGALPALDVAEAQMCETPDATAARLACQSPPRTDIGACITSPTKEASGSPLRSESAPISRGGGAPAGRRCRDRQAAWRSFRAQARRWAAGRA